ncbi:MAG: LCP family protein [Patescibacteria group bacterium]
MALLPETTVPPTPQATNRGKFFLYLLLIVVLLLLTWWSRQPQVQATFADWQQHSVWENIKRLTGSPDKQLRGEVDGRINMVLLGMGGVAHEGPYLTDTIIVASLNPQTADLGLLSIPRDLAVTIPGNGIRKINSANAYGEAKEPGSGALLASTVIANTLALPIHYYVRIDFNGFIGLINQLGGLKIKVERAFTDPQYPTTESLTRTISFEEGEQLMSGERVLEYVRSRHGSNWQGTDFARSRRQQQVLIALKEKLLKLSTFLNPRLLVKLYNTFQENIETNLEPWEVIKLSNIFKEVNTNQVVHQVLDIETSNLLREARGEDGAYFLVPRGGDYRELQLFASDLLAYATARSERATIIIENGTSMPGLAQQIAALLTEHGLQVISYGNAESKDYQNTLVYDFTNKTKPASAQAILELLELSQTENSEEQRQQEDFLIILGQDKVKVLP